MYIQIVVDGHNESVRECISRLEGMDILYMQDCVCSDSVDGHNMLARECILRLARMGIMCMQESVCSHIVCGHNVHARECIFRLGGWAYIACKRVYVQILCMG